MLNTRNKKQQVVLPGKKWVVRLENLVDDEEFNQSNEVPPLDTSILPEMAIKRLLPRQKDGENDKYAKKMLM